MHFRQVIRPLWQEDGLLVMIPEGFLQQAVVVVVNCHPSDELQSVGVVSWHHH